MSGLISRHDKDWLVVSTADKSMILIEKSFKNKKNKNIISDLKQGDRFVTSLSKLYLARKDRIKYNSRGLISKANKK